MDRLKNSREGNAQLADGRDRALFKFNDALFIQLQHRSGGLQQTDAILVREIFRVFLYSRALLRFFSSLDKCVLAVAVVRPNAAAPPEIEPRSTILANTIR